MAHAVEMLDDRDPCLAAHPLDQPLAAARHDHVDELGHAHELTHRRTLGGVDELDGIKGQLGGAETGVDARGDGAVRADGLRAAAQDHGIPRFQTEPGHLRGHVRA
jgi:hypothetical protein